ncbi:hypothetical protein EU803_03525 [Loktanella sp. IMCC34160]|uniref:hypothetical protein n=1 Tax=Loktanella sp. IMCC34160 TaxID=2510646 RepID=UPI00101E1CF0|nr:hypothetical protein [Loktanella sp. IMCC34160]RYG93183.1 hypothetical protein EU803_03525 [Loktanella sp. IMCC34160]
MTQIGHNGGPTMEPGHSWRKTSWQKARKSLLPSLPVEVVRLRVKRARELGLPYKTYAGFRASTGHDLIGFLFSSNALGVETRQEISQQAKEVLSRINADRTAIVHAPVRPEDVVAANAIDAAFAAPNLTHSWSEIRNRLKAIARARGYPADRFVIVGKTALERDWVAACGAAGYLDGTTYFDTAFGAV